ncbi:MAG TPA: HAD hydrolase family protein [Bacillales bacterium]|nr:HAD hydrolase family protein [Bacillales bacterium]
MKNVAFIPVRGGSKSIPLKNIKSIAGKPLVQWVLEAVNDCEEIDEVYVSTDSSEISNVVGDMNLGKINIIDRSQESATDEASSEIPLLEFAQNTTFDHVIFIQATSPLLTADDLSGAIKQLNESDCDSLLSVVRQKRFIWQEGKDGCATPQNYDIYQRPRRQEFNGFLVENGAFYITSKESLIKNQCRISGDIAYYEMPQETYYEIDEDVDWTVVETLLELRKRNADSLADKLSKIKMLVMDCDGVLTDGGMYYSEHGDELKKFNTKDGMGIRFLKESGIKTVLITGEDVQLVRNRAEKLRIDEIYCGVDNKLEILDMVLERNNISYQQVAYIGDDINDYEVMTKAGVAFSVCDGMEKVKNTAHYITKKNGGNGAVREVCEFILNHRR